MKQDNDTLAQDLSETEMLPVVDEQGRVTGRASRRQCHSGSRLLHPVVHLHIFSPQGHIYLQQRSPRKFIQPGKWDTAVGGHMDWGETVEQALRREVSEELGFTGFTAVPMFTYVYDSSVERELVNTFATVTSQQRFNYDPVEVADGRFWTLREVQRQLGRGVLTPNFEDEFRRLLPLLPKLGLPDPNDENNQQ